MVGTGGRQHDEDGDEDDKDDNDNNDEDDEVDNDDENVDDYNDDDGNDDNEDFDELIIAGDRNADFDRVNAYLNRVKKCDRQTWIIIGLKQEIATCSVKYINWLAQLT